MRRNLSRQKLESISETNLASLGCSYTHVKTLKGVIGPSTQKVVMYHAFLESLEGFEDTEKVEIAYLGFNRIRAFRVQDAKIHRIDVLDLVGNPIKNLTHCPPCRELIVSATLISNLVGCPEGVEIIRCGHSTHLLSLEGCPSTVKIIECSCSPNLILKREHLPVRLEELLTDSDLLFHK